MKNITRLPQDCSVKLSLKSEYLSIGIHSKEMNATIRAQVKFGWFFKIRCKMAYKKLIRSINKSKIIRDFLGAQ